ncbi:hypothetical protein RRG08_021649 [Elysia crispata]|uniref:Uncharacterized protein n=1 Tax=Elysia crispata TaxID=231223 RepID=A0AAE0XEH4_9GAST|nr:hypothetical protein RRG08_021649 [Elysia crispata]
MSPASRDKVHAQFVPRESICSLLITQLLLASTPVNTADRLLQPQNERPRRTSHASGDRTSLASDDLALLVSALLLILPCCVRHVCLKLRYLGVVAESRSIHLLGGEYSPVKLHQFRLNSTAIGSDLESDPILMTDIIFVRTHQLDSVSKSGLQTQLTSAWILRSSVQAKYGGEYLTGIK